MWPVRRLRAAASTSLDALRAQPALLPDGWRYGPPDYVGVAAQRSGTTWWDALVAAHPGVYRAPHALKEKDFFERFPARPFGAHDVERYQRLFPRPPGALTGEWTPFYLSEVWTAPLLARAAPDARILALLRDPVERYRSGLAHFGRMQPLTERERHRILLGRGFYGAQLRGLQECFPRERVLVLQFERCVEDPAAELRRTYAFLGLDESFAPDEAGSVRNASATAKPELPRQLAEGLRAAYRDDARWTVEEFGLDAKRWPTLA